MCTNFPSVDFQCCGSFFIIYKTWRSILTRCRLMGLGNAVVSGSFDTFKNVRIQIGTYCVDANILQSIFGRNYVEIQVVQFSQFTMDFQCVLL